jgi:hypothetical protein
VILAITLTWSVAGCAHQASKGTIAPPRPPANVGTTIRAENKAGAQRLPKPLSAVKSVEPARDTRRSDERADPRPVPTIGELDSPEGDAPPAAGTNSDWVAVLTYEKNPPSASITGAPETSSSNVVRRSRQVSLAVALLAIVAGGLVLWLASRRRVRG